MVHDIHILDLVIFKFCKLSKQQSMLDELEIHVHSMVFQDNYLIALNIRVESVEGEEPEVLNPSYIERGNR